MAISLSLSLSFNQVSQLWSDALEIDGHRNFLCRYHLVKAYSTEAAPVLSQACGPLEFVFIDVRYP
jgi:hypothetical protein